MAPRSDSIVEAPIRLHSGYRIVVRIVSNLEPCNI